MAPDPLVEARRELHAVNEELDSLAYGVSHDLRSPLRAVIGFAQMLQEDCGAALNEDGQRYLDIIRKSALKLEQLVAGLLDYTRVGRQALNIGTVDMNALVQRSLATVRAAAPGREPQITVHPLPNAHADPDLLYYVWNNLLANALAFTARAEIPHIEIHGSLGQGEATWYVRDNGVGFDMRYASKLFGVFQRLHSQDEFPGTGMGLAVARRIVMRHGGRIWAQAQPQQGATFFFALPLEPSMG